jgi:hypothetical protein
MTDDEIYKVIIIGTMKYIAMPKESSGFYLRKLSRDGAVTFLPVKMPKREHGRFRDSENPEEMPIEQPIACQSVEQRGSVPK